MISGKTTLLKSKAVSLARSGESVSYIVMGGSGKTESVMSIATRLDFAQYHPKIKVMSQQELTKFYWNFHPSWWSRWPITPSPLSLLKFYIEKEKPQNVMVDELPLQSNRIRSLFRPLSVFFSSPFSLLIFSLGFSLQCLFLIVFFQLHRTGPESMQLANDLFMYISLPVLIYIVIGMIVLLFVPPHNLNKTGSLLRSLPPLLPSSSSSLWLALHSRPFTELEVRLFRSRRSTLLHHAHHQASPLPPPSPQSTFLCTQPLKLWGLSSTPMMRWKDPLPLFFFSTTKTSS